MSTSIQFFVLIAGAIFTGVGLALFAKRRIGDQNTIKIAGVEFQLAGSSLVVFVVGCGLIVFAAWPQTFSKDRAKIEPSTQSPTVLPAAQSSPPEFSEESSYDADLVAAATSESIEDLTAHPVKSIARVTRALLGHDNHGHKIFQIELTIQSVWDSLHVPANKPPSFSFDEEIGPTRLLYFCCLPRSGVSLSRGQTRKFLLFFQMSDGYSGEDMFFHVKDFPPILNAQWRFRHAQ